MKRAVSTIPRIAIDLMGSDAPPTDLLKVVIQYAEAHSSSAQLIVIANPSLIKEIPPSLSLVPASEVITMEDDPLHAIRRKKDSSLCMGIRLVKQGKIDAFVSAGNTGALIAHAKMQLATLKGIDRPALLALLPTMNKELAVLDVGANISFKAEHLIQFAAMGIAYQISRGIPCPSLGLLNIGTEEKKGTAELRKAYKKLQLLYPLAENRPHFVGNIEARDVFQGNIDLLVTDGFTGNIFLKTAEGIAAFAMDEIEHAAHQKYPEGGGAALSALRKRLHYAEHPGAILCGVRGIVVKCHGDAAAQSLFQSIGVAARLVSHHFLDVLTKKLTLS